MAVTRSIIGKTIPKVGVEDRTCDRVPSNYGKIKDHNFFLTTTIVMWKIVSGSEKMLGLCESDRQSLTVGHIRIVAKKVIVLQLLSNY